MPSSLIKGNQVASDDKWRPFERSPYPRGLAEVRWALYNLNLFNVNLLGKPMAMLGGFTAGEAAVLALSSISFATQGLTGDTEDSGEAASNAFGVAFATASHNSVFLFVLGLPFERALFWHKYFAVWAIVL